MIEPRAPPGASSRRTSRRSATGFRARVVDSFAQGAAALKAGKQIRYVGPGGPTSFDAYHDSAGLFQVDRYARREGAGESPGSARPSLDPAGQR